MTSNYGFTVGQFARIVDFSKPLGYVFSRHQPSNRILEHVIRIVVSRISHIIDENTAITNLSNTKKSLHHTLELYSRTSTLEHQHRYRRKSSRHTSIERETSIGVLYASRESHYSIFKAARYYRDGLGKYRHSTVWTDQL